MIFSIERLEFFMFMRKLEVLRMVEGFFEFHSSATEGEKDNENSENGNFLANRKKQKLFTINN